MRHLDTFSGLGGFALAAETVWPDIEHIFCEIDPFCQAVLKKHWPQSKIYGDIKTLKTEEKIDLLTASPPCQPVSSAGRKRGSADDRWLWGQTLDVIKATKPVWIVLENVCGLLSARNGVEFGAICSLLEAQGYETRTFIIPASAVGAPHRRDRLWILGYADNHRRHGTENRQGGLKGIQSDKKGKKEVRQSTRPALARSDAQSKWQEDPLQIAAKFSRMDDGVLYRMERIKALGNAIVPQVAIEIFKAIKKSTPHL